MRRLRTTILWLGLLLAPVAHAHSVGTELTVGRGFVGLTLQGEVELRADQTFLSLGYAGARPGRDAELAHLFSMGLDHAPSSGWLLAATASLAPRAVQRVELEPRTYLRATSGSAGLNLAVAHDSGGFSDLEHAQDASVTVTRYRLTRELVQPGGADGLVTPVTVLRPALGVTAILWLDTELSVRGSWVFYSTDPLSAGQLSEDQVEQLQRRARRLGIAGAGLVDSLLAADALSGLPTAPLRAEARVALSHRFGRKVRAQLSYTLDRYVPTQGWGHIAAVKGWFKVSPTLRLSASVLTLVDVPEQAAALASVLGSFGVELRF